MLRWMRKAPRNPEPAKRWMAFLSNHREAIAVMAFFTMQTLTFGVLYCIPRTSIAQIERCYYQYAWTTLPAFPDVI